MDALSVFDKEVEEMYVIKEIESKIAQELGEPIRLDHGNAFDVFMVDSPLKRCNK